MTLEEIINEYLTESYSIFKYLDKDGRDIKVRFLFDTHRDYLDKYLSFYKSLPNLTEVVVFACDGVFKLVADVLRQEKRWLYSLVMAFSN